MSYFEHTLYYLNIYNLTVEGLLADITVQWEWEVVKKLSLLIVLNQ